MRNHYTISSESWRSQKLCCRRLTCAQSNQRICLQKRGDQVLGINRKSLISFWPHYVIYQKQADREREIMVDGTWLTVCFTYQLRSVSNDAISTEILWSLTCNDLSKQLLWSVSKKRHAAHQELIQDDAHRPPVHWLSITLTKNNLWGDILWSSAHLKVKQQSVVS